MSTTPDLPTLYARVTAVCPEIAGQVKRAKRNEVWDAGHWECGFSGRFIPDALAESLIIAACVRVLPGYWWKQGEEGEYVVYDSFGRLVCWDRSLVEALLLAVEAKGKA